jgi:uncharacterized membrane protein
MTHLTTMESGPSETTRLETFSDGVFAIAITLLVLEIRVPESGADAHALGASLASLWPSYVGYAISFATIGIMWVNHHAMFRYIARTDRWFLLANVFFLMCVSFLPFPTGVLAEHLAEADGRETAALFYGGTLMLTAIAFNVVWWAAAYRGRLLGAALDHEGVRTISKRYRAGPPGYLVATLLALVSVPTSLAVHVILALLFALPETGQDAEGSAMASRA